MNIEVLARTMDREAWSLYDRYVRTREYADKELEDMKSTVRLANSLERAEISIYGDVVPTNSQRFGWM